MPDLHISAQLISAPPQAAGAPAAAPDPAAPAGPAEAFAALLAGRLGAQALPDATAPALKPAAGAVDTQAPPAEAPAEAPLPAVAGADPRKDAKDAKGESDSAQPGTPYAAAQLLAEMGALTPQATPRTEPAGMAQPPAEGPTSASNGAFAAAGPAPVAPGTRTTTDAAQAARMDKDTPERSAGQDSALPDASDSDPAPVHAQAATHAPAPAPETAVVPGAQQPAQSAVQPAAHQPMPAPIAAPAPAVHMTVPGPVGTPLWREEFSASVSMLATQRVSSAELRVQPAELGPVQVSIRIEAGEANITCAAQHADTRHALESALPRLREMLESNGISVGSASVGTHPQGSGAGGNAAWGAPGGQARGPGAPDSAPAEVRALLPAEASRAYARSDRLLDVFA
jgi:flagellar hook-length control protein FliK